MSRRPHKKSRNGCFECKSRHIKCDENHPVCANCRTAELRCSFLGKDSAFIAPEPVSHYNQRPTSAFSHNVSSSSSPGPSTILSQRLHSGQESSDPYILNMTHLQLFNNISSKEFLSFEAQDQVSIMSAVIFAKYILPTPYLMHESLALSALHLSIASPHARDFHREYATGLQTRALALFNDNLPVLDLNTTNCTPMFLFASLIAAHLLCDTLHHETANLDHFIDKFTNCLTIHHGILTISSQCWDLLRETELGPRLRLGAELMRARDDCGSDCSALNELIDAAAISPDSRKTYRQSISDLQKVFDAERAYPARQFDSQLVSAWPIIVSSEYVDLLRRQEPEALVILAYYAILLHRCRDSWLYGEGGRFLIESICGRLGIHWQYWLSFPKSVLLENPSG